MYKLIAYIGTDKLLHALTCMVLVLELKRIFPLYIAALIVLLIGIAKEFIDLISKKGTPDVKDMIANVVGILLAMI